MVFPVVTYGWELDYKENWVPKNWYFRIVVLEKTLESPLDYKKIKPVNPQGNQTWIFTEGLLVKLMLQYFGHLMGRIESLEKTLMLGKVEDRGRRGWQRMRWLDDITNSMDMSLSKLRCGWWTGKPGVLQSMRSKRFGHDWANELNWSRSSVPPLGRTIPLTPSLYVSGLPKNRKFPPDPVIHTSKGDSTNLNRVTKINKANVKGKF